MMRGELQFISGCMFAGKTEELLKRVRIENVAGRTVQLFKPSLDARYNKTAITSHNNSQLEAHLVWDTADLRKRLEKDVHVIAIDELQFFDDAIIPFCIEQIELGRKIITAALRQDFRGEPFCFRDSTKHVGELMPYANVTSLSAVCTSRLSDGSICGEAAEYNQRMIDGAPATYDSPLILVGSSESYEARCQLHFEKPTPLKQDVLVEVAAT